MKLELDATVYSLEAVQKAAYRFIDRLTILIAQSPGQIRCDIEQVSGKLRPIEDVVADFKRELLDQQLRYCIKAETEASRNLILALAFSQSAIAS
ncbi:His-Xaa-Ser system protein HxsD [Sphingomonas sp. NCPPB 2930]